jgi:hypothetical protein
MARIVASQPMSKITLRRIVTLGTQLLYHKTALIGAVKFWQYINRGKSAALNDSDAAMGGLGTISVD